MVVVVDMLSRATLMEEEPKCLADIVTDKKVILLFFWAEWATPSIEMGQVFSDLSERYGDKIHFSKFEVEKAMELTEEVAIESVPAFIFVSGKKIVERFEGANATLLGSLVEKYYQKIMLEDAKRVTDYSNSSGMKIGKDDNVTMTARLETLIKASPVMLFMKGSPDTPRCGFSRQIVQLLREKSVSFGFFDILKDETVREELKKYSDWPTYPQLYIQGELVGGLDIVKEAIESGSFDEMLPPSKPESLEDRLGQLISKDHLMIFIKGTPEEPRCGFTRQLIGLLEGYKYSYFDILSDEEVRQGLKTFSNWPTFPQIYVAGELMGGLDIIKDMKENGEFDILLRQ